MHGIIIRMISLVGWPKPVNFFFLFVNGCMMVMQVEPLLEVLVGKCLEQGLMEVMEEEELAAMRTHQQHYEQVRCLAHTSASRGLVVTKA